MIIRAHSVRVLVSWIAVVVVILAGRVVGMAAVAVGSPGVCGGGHGQEEETEEDRNEFFHGDTNFQMVRSKCSREGASPCRDAARQRLVRT